ncbi:MAG: hypothetical protein EOO24_57805, partial [Comamonadaceae bacterium]
MFEQLRESLLANGRRARPASGGAVPVLDGWRVLRRLGGHAGASTFLVEPAAGGATHLLDLAWLDGALAPPALDHLRHTFALLLAIDCPHLARVVHHAVGTTHACIVMEHVTGASLRTRLGAPLDPATALTWLRQAASALAALHAAGLVHGALTPGSWLLREDDSLVLADIGARTWLA